MPSTNEEIVDSYERIIKTKEDIKDLIGKSKNSQELYHNAIMVLTNMESNFQGTLFDIANKEKWSEDKRARIFASRFDDYLDIENPITLFEKKGKELIEKAKSKQENLYVKNLGTQIIKSNESDSSLIDDTEKNKLIDELFQTRENAIHVFKDDVTDDLLEDEQNISEKDVIKYGTSMGYYLFDRHNENLKEFNDKINKMNLLKLSIITFNIYDGSGAFEDSYGMLKKKLGNKNLFDFIDEQSKFGDVLKYSAFNMLFQRRKSNEVFKWIDGYSGNKEDLIKYVKDNIEKDENFKISFLTSIKDLENSEYFSDIAKDLKEKDSNVKKAYEATLNIDNVDVFKDKKINGLVVYDNAGQGGGSDFFDRDFSDYKKKGFNEISKEDNKGYIKYVLKKANDTITMVKIKNLKFGDMEDDVVKNELKSVVGQEDYNLFALRGHCYNTSQVINVLGLMNIVGEGDLLIDGGCGNAIQMGNYYKSGIRGQIFAYTSQGRGGCTKAFVDKIIEYKNSGKSFSDVLGYYNGLTSDSSRDGYFAFNTERPDSVGAQYKKLIKPELWVQVEGI